MTIAQIVAAGLTSSVLWAACSIDDRQLVGSPHDSGSGDGNAMACTNANTVVAPADGVIALFIGEDPFYTFNSGPTAFTPGEGVLNIVENQPAKGTIQYPGLGINFPSCIDASTFSGVEFMLSGTLSGCAMQFGINYTEDLPTISSPLGSCPQPVCYPPEVSINPTSTLVTTRIAWSDRGSAPGAPVAYPADARAVVDLQWQFAIPAAADGSADTCLANVDITGLKFYR